jgi:hypothetical protein
MPRRLFDAEYIFGLHEPGGEQHMLDEGRPGWIVFTEELGRDPNNYSGKDFSPWSNRNLGILCRLNHGYHPNGTIPSSAYYEDFARRCANFVTNSQGCKIWIIGNEPNYDIERPSLMGQAAPLGAAAPSSATASSSATRPLARALEWVLRGLSGGMGDAELLPQPTATARKEQSDQDPFYHGAPGRFSALHPQPAQAAAAPGPAAAPQAAEVITPELYARCYRLCRDAIRRVPGHADDQVLVAAVAPWNDQTKYPGNPNGDWVQYLQDILRLLGPTGCDGITLHTYTHGFDPNLVFDAAKMNPPFQNRHYHFFAYRDFMGAIPADMRHLPVYLTETDQDVPWLDQNTGWVRNAYGEINWWNSQPGNQQIRAMVLYRWPNIDRWVIETKAGVIADFRQALKNDYRWRETTPPTPPTGFRSGETVETTDIVNLRRTPGYVNKPANDRLIEAPAGARFTVLNGTSTRADNLTWWNVRYAHSGQPNLDGWAAQTAPGGQTLLRSVAAPPNPPPTGTFKVGDMAKTTTTVNLRRSPGFNNKPPEDVLISLPPDTSATIVNGPRTADGLTWWQLRGTVNGRPFDGWAAEKSPTGQTLLVQVAPPSVPEPPPATGKFKVGDGVVTQTIVRLRRTPGITGKPANDVIADIAQGVRGTVTGGPQSVDSLTWWQVHTTLPTGTPVNGWIAESAPGGVPLIEKVTGSVAPPPPPQGSFAIGELATTTDTVRIRRTPGINNKPPEDTLGAFAPRATLNILEGPRTADGLTWWRVGGISQTGASIIGWVAEKAPGGAALVTKAPKLPGTNIPDRAAGLYLGAPYGGSFGISQLWGENPQIYSGISYDGVPLRGHNGIDYLTPNGTPILVVDNGVVQEAVTNDPTGFGNYVKVRHNWGESLYAHLQSYSVQQGQQVSRGQPIGLSDNTGFSFGPHLHFSIRINPFDRKDGWGGFSDPLPYLNPQSFQLPAYVRDASAAAMPAFAPARPGEGTPYRPLEQAPGYAPDRPGLRRP